MSSKGGASKITSKVENTGLENPITWYKSKVGTYPSNVQTWWTMKRPPQATPDNLQTTYLEVFDPDMRNQITYGNTLAPKGHYIFDAFAVDRSSVSGISSLSTETTAGLRPKQVAFYAGRVFYAGTQTGKWNSRIYFSQILERDDQVGLCYQQQDPTSEDAPDLLPSDGGIIFIPEMGEVIRLYPYGGSLYVFCLNGIWQIGGSTGAGFKANDYSAQRISTVSSYGPLSFVEADAGLMWWSRSSIWAMTAAQTGGMQVQSLTDHTIKDFYNDIPTESKRYVKGAYNKQTKIVQWVYRDTAPTTTLEQYTYNKILCFDTRTGAFYPWNPIQGASVGEVSFSGIIALEGDATVDTPDDVYAGPNRVKTTGASGDEWVISSVITKATVESVFKYLVFIGV